MSLTISGAPYTLLYVDDVAATVADLSRLFGIEPAHNSPTFALFLIAGGKLGLWRIDTVEPAVSERPGAGEFALALSGGRKAVEAAFDHAVASGLTILQPPTAMDFGFTFAVRLADGNRIRMFEADDDQG